MNRHDERVVDHASFETLAEAVEQVTEAMDEQLMVQPSKCTVANLRILMTTLSSHLKSASKRSRELRAALPVEHSELPQNVISLADRRESRKR